MPNDFFAPLHVLMLLISAVVVFGSPFLAGFFLGRYVEEKKHIEAKKVNE